MQRNEDRLPSGCPAGRNIPQNPSPNRAPTALFASTQHWNSVFQLGSHHIARCFAQRGWRVGFVSAPISPLHLAGLGSDVAEREASWRAGGSIDAATGVWHYVPFAPLPGAQANRSRSHDDAFGMGALPAGLASVLRRAGFDRPQLAYTDHFLHEGLLRAASPERVVFRRADNLAGFPGAASDFPAREADFARRSDLTICTTESSLAHMTAQGVPHAMLMRNSIQLDRFFGEAPPPPEYLDDDRPIVVYVGSAEHRLDIDLVVRGVTELRQLRWVNDRPVWRRGARTSSRCGRLRLGKPAAQSACGLSAACSCRHRAVFLHAQQRADSRGQSAEGT